MPACPSCSRAMPADGAFCPGCGTPVSAGSASVTQTNLETDAPPPRESGRFLPGAVLANRFRIVGPLGRGGMGEVYRADDLKLGQAVALKFLPEALERDPGRLARLLAEVRIARQISHPNVTRVFDVVEFHGQHFLAMEYVDGEDLKSLLVRIGRLPEDRAVQVSRELCAGLAAAHDQGVLHRDLKPANVMLDGRGRARITDFGLAAMAGEVSGADIRSGTPAYMAPEQLAGREVTPRSDIYSLGLVLYELFTGQAAFSAVERLNALQSGQETTPSSPSVHVKSLDPAIERVILRCLDPDPAARPASALAVAAALPGGDPLAAALAAGETPSPEVVAAAGGVGGLRPAVAAACLAAAVLGLVCAAMIAHRYTLFFQLPNDKPPDALQERAVEILAEAGAGEAKDTLRGFTYDLELLRRPELNGAGASHPVAARLISFWYRQSPGFMMAGDATRERDTFAQPPWLVPGMAGVRLDQRGRLIELIVTPGAEDAPAPAPPDWVLFLARTPVGQARLRAVPPEGVPPVFADSRWAWVSDDGAHVEAGAFRNRPAYLLVGRSLTGDEPAPSAVGFVVFQLLLFGLCGWLAQRNVRLGRGDVAGARRLAVFATVAAFGGFSLLYRPRLGLHPTMAFLGIAVNSFFVAFYWASYMAIEPFVRRRWPDTLTSWMRLLSGRPFDPRVGRDLLLGALAGVALANLDYLSIALGEGGGVTSLQRPPLELVLGGWRAPGAILRAFGAGALFAMLQLLVLMLLRVLLRNEWLASGVAVALSTAALGGAATAQQFLVYLVLFALVTAVMVRLGLLAGAITLITWNVLTSVPLTWHLGAWYSDCARWSLATVLVMAVSGFAISIRGQARPARAWDEI